MRGRKKNMGPAGATLVIIKEAILGKVERHIPSMLNYQVHIDKESMFNYTFCIRYLCLYVDFTVVKRFRGY